MKNINAHRKGLVQSILATIDTVKSRVSTLAAQPSIESACPLATYSRDYRRINPLDQRFPFPGQRRPGLNLSLSFQLDRSMRHIPCNRISRKKIPSPRAYRVSASYANANKVEYVYIFACIRIDASVVELWIVIVRNSKACDEAETRDASYVESTDRFPCSVSAGEHLSKSRIHLVTEYFPE